MKRYFLLPVLLILSLLFLCKTEKQPPNFVFILVDDLGWADVKCNTPASFYHTPNIDKLAESHSG